MRTRMLKKRRDESVRSIMDAAMEVFAEVGYEGARVDDIADRAGISKSMIYYRVGDKEALYAAVIQDVFGDTAERISENIRQNLSPEEKCRIYIAEFAKAISQRPSFSKIMIREMASGWTNFSEVVVKDLTEILVIVKEIIDEGVREGVFTDINPLVMFLMIIGALLFFNLSLPLRTNFQNLAAGRVDIPDSDSLDVIVSEVQRIALLALKKDYRTCL